MQPLLNKSSRAQKTAAEESGAPVSPLQILKDPPPKPRTKKPKIEQTESESDASSSQPPPSATSLLFESIASADTKTSDSEINTLQSTSVTESNIPVTAQTYALVHIWDSTTDVATASSTSPPAYSFHLGSNEIQDVLAFIKDKYPSSLRAEIPAPSHTAPAVVSMVDKEVQVQDTELTPIPENRSPAQPQQPQTASPANGSERVIHNREKDVVAQPRPKEKQNRLRDAYKRKHVPNDSNTGVEKEVSRPAKKKRTLRPLFDDDNNLSKVHYDAETGDLILAPDSDDEIIDTSVRKFNPGRYVYKKTPLFKSSKAAKDIRDARLESVDKLYGHSPEPLPAVTPISNMNRVFSFPEYSDDESMDEVEDYNLPLAPKFDRIQAGYDNPESSPFVEHPESIASPTALVRPKDQSAPVTPLSASRRARNWLIGNLSRSVSRFIPRLGTDAQDIPTNPQEAAATDSPQSSLDPAAITRPESVTPTRSQRSPLNLPSMSKSNEFTPRTPLAFESPDTAPNANGYASEFTPSKDAPSFMSQTTDALARLKKASVESPLHFQSPATSGRLSTIVGSENDETPNSAFRGQTPEQPRYGAFNSEPSTGYRGMHTPKFNNSAFTWKSRDIKRAQKPKTLLSNNAFIDTEVERRVSSALEKAAEEKPTVIEKKIKRKRRSSPDVIPNPEGASYGMDLDYFVMSSSDNESDGDEEDPLPSKRPRYNDCMPSPENENEEDLRHARPYQGTMFDKPVRPKSPPANLFESSLSQTEPNGRHIPTNPVHSWRGEDGNMHYVCKLKKNDFEDHPHFKRHRYKENRLEDQIWEENNMAWHDRLWMAKRDGEGEEKRQNEAEAQAEALAIEEENGHLAQRNANEKARVLEEKLVADEKIRKIIQGKMRTAEAAQQARTLAEEKIQSKDFSTPPDQRVESVPSMPSTSAPSSVLPTPARTGIFDFSKSQPASMFGSIYTGSFNSTQSQMQPGNMFASFPPKSNPAGQEPAASIFASSSAQEPTRSFDFTKSQQAPESPSNAFSAPRGSQSSLKDQPVSIFASSSIQKPIGSFNFTRPQPIPQTQAAPKAGPLTEQSPNVLTNPPNTPHVRPAPQNPPRSILKRQSTAANGPELSPLSKARANATMYTPKNPSGLGHVENAQVTPKSSPIQPRPITDPAVIAELKKLRDEDLALVTFSGAGMTHEEAGLLSPEVVAAFDKYYSQSDGENATNHFELHPDESNQH